jgi:hypothetical protein
MPLYSLYSQADDSKTLSSYQVKDQCVIFSISSVGEALAAATDPDLALDAVKQIQGISYICVLIPLYMCPHTTLYVCS